MFNEERHDFCSEFYTVEKSIEVVVQLQNQSAQIRIDALKNERMGYYDTRAYRKTNFTLQPTYPQNQDTNERVPEEYWVWVVYDLPSTHLNTADAALQQSLGFLEENCS